MNESSLKEIWQNPNIWGKSTLAVLLVMWFAFSAEIVVATNDNIISTIVFLCLLWLGFVIIAFTVARITGGFEDS